MIDMHYDLLSILYYCYLRNDFRYIETLRKNFNDNNVNGVIANLYFMSEEEMKDEMLGKKIDAVEMFKISTSLFKKFFPNLKALFSIEGCDYIKDINELEKLKNLGLSSILLVWNNKNKYGGGTFFKGGLTNEGKVFIKKAIELGICKQIEAIKKFNPVVGLVSYSFFLTKDDEDIEILKQKYLKHIDTVIQVLGIDGVGISTDDMSYDNVLFNNPIEKIIFSYEHLKKDLVKLLKTKYSDEEINKILETNIKNKLFS